MIKFALLLLLFTPNESVSKKNKNNEALQHPFTNIFTDTPALSTLNKWAIEAIKNGGSVSFSDAYERESMVVTMINQGAWPLHVYEEYQYFSAGLGNVDSARLLVQYSVDPIMADVMSREIDSSRMVNAAAKCRVDDLRTMLAAEVSDPDQSLPDGTTPLMAAAYANCAQAITVLLAEGADSELTARNGMNALMVAACAGHSEAISALVRGRASLTARHKFAGTSALHMAAEMGQVDAIYTLCSFGIDADMRTAVGGNALHTAAQVGASASVPALVAKPCSVAVGGLMNGDTTALYVAAQHGHWRTVRALLKAGTDADYAMPLSAYRGSQELSVGGKGGDTGAFIPNSQAGNGACAIHAAAENGHAKVVRVLLDEGRVRVDSMCALGVTALHLAAQYDRMDVAKLLLLRGADVDAHSKVDGSTALYYAAGHGYLDMVRLLLRAGANCLQPRQDRIGFPLMYAALTGRFEVLQIMLASLPSEEVARDVINTSFMLHNVCALLDRQKDEYLLVLAALVQTGARVDTAWPDQGLRTPLHLAARSGSLRAVRMLLLGTTAQNITAEGLVNTPSGGDGSTALHYACSPGAAQSFTGQRLEVVDLLIKAGGDVNAPVIAHRKSKLQGATPLYVAAASPPAVSDAPALVRRLLAAQADPNRPLDESVGGFTPLVAAIDYKNEKVVEALLFPQKPATASGEGYVATADPNIGASVQMSSSQSPLLLAVVKSSARIVSMLLTAGAHCNLAVAISATSAPLSLIGFARSRRNYDVLQALTAYPSCIEADEGTSAKYSKGENREL